MQERAAPINKNHSEGRGKNGESNGEAERIRRWPEDKSKLTKLMGRKGRTGRGPREEATQ